MEYFTQVTLLAGLSVVIVQQILKLKVVPIAFANRYPVPTNILLSSIASVIVIWQEKLNVQPTNWTDYVALIVTIVVVSTVTYNNTLRNWSQLKLSEGEGK